MYIIERNDINCEGLYYEYAIPTVEFQNPLMESAWKT